MAAYTIHVRVPGHESLNRKLPYGPSDTLQILRSQIASLYSVEVPFTLRVPLISRTIKAGVDEDLLLSTLFPPGHEHEDLNVFCVFGVSFDAELAHVAVERWEREQAMDKAGARVGKEGGGTGSGESTVEASAKSLNAATGGGGGNIPASSYHPFKSPAAPQGNPGEASSSHPFKSPAAPQGNPGEGALDRAPCHG